ncbi:hypothetical protein ACX8XP_17830 [Calditrichota bacterium LG25]
MSFYNCTKIFKSRPGGIDLPEEVFQDSQAASKTNRNTRKVIFSQIAPIIAEKE